MAKVAQAGHDAQSGHGTGLVTWLPPVASQTSAGSLLCFSDLMGRGETVPVGLAADLAGMGIAMITARPRCLVQRLTLTARLWSGTTLSTPDQADDLL